MAENKGRPCVVPGCSWEGEPMLVYTLGRTFSVCRRHRPEIHELDLEALAQALLVPEGMHYKSPMGQIVAYSEVFPEYDDGEDMPAAQAAIHVLSGEFLEERDLRERAVGVIEEHSGGSRVVWVDPYLEPDFAVFLEDEQMLAPYERPDACARLARVAATGGGVTAWYALQVYPGYENKVKANLERRARALGMQDEILRALVPVESHVVFKDGKKMVVAEKTYPGYVFVEMVMSDDSWNVVRNIPGVIGFVGPGNRPAALKVTGSTGPVQRKAGGNAAPPRAPLPSTDKRKERNQW